MPGLKLGPGGGGGGGGAVDSVAGKTGTVVLVNADITDLEDDFYTESEVDTALAGKSSTSHNHSGVYEPVQTAASAAEMAAGTETTRRAMSPSQVERRRVSAFAARNADLTIANATWTLVAWEIEEVDQDTMIDLGTQSGRITCQRNGRARVYVNVNFDQNATSYRAVRIDHVRSGTPTRIAMEAWAGFTGIVNFKNMHGEIDVLSGDYFEVYALQNSGGNLNMTGRTLSGTAAMLFKVTIN